MASLTGVEIGPDSCVVVCARPAPNGGLALSFAHRLEFPETAQHDGRLARALGELRRSAGLPRALFGVSWTAGSPQALLAQAGFQVKSMISPPQALAILARRHNVGNTGGDGLACLALNRRRASFAIVRGPRLLFTRTFEWTAARAPLPSSKHAPLLRRYLYIAQLAPELQHAVDTVRLRYGIRVGSAITCGDIPDLRSLAMPLIDELDLEVETLDSTEGLTVPRGPEGWSLVDDAPALWLACAATDAPRPAPRVLASPQFARSAAALFSVAVFASAGWATWIGRTAAATILPPVAIPVRTAPAVVQDVSLERDTTSDAPVAVSEGGGIVVPSIPDTAVERSIVAPVPTTGSIVPRARPDRRVPSMRPTADRATDATGGLASPSGIPAPAVDLILTGDVRNIALVDGRFVEAGDEVGALQVVNIDSDGVTLRDRLGALLRVPAASDIARIPRGGRGTRGPGQP